MSGLEVLTIAGAATQGAGGFLQARAAQKAAQQNVAFAQEVGERNAQAILAQAGAEETRLRRDRARRLGATRAAFGAAGVQVEGTPLDVLADQVATAEEEALLIRHGGVVGAENARIGGAIRARDQRIAAGQAKQQGATSLLGAGFSIGETLLE